MEFFISLKMENKKYHIILLSIIFALLLWFLINMNYEYSTSSEIRINILNLNNIALKTPLPESFKIKIKGRGWDLLAFHLTKNIEFNLDLAQAKSGAWHIDKKNIIEGISLPHNLSIIDASIDSIHIYTDKLDSVKLPIKLEADIKFKDGYASIGEIELRPDSIIIKGAKSILDTLKEWRTKTMLIKDVSEKIKINVPLADMPKYVLETDIKEVELSLVVEPIADKTLSGVNISINSLPINREIILIPPKIDLIIRGSINRLSEISTEQINVYVEYTDIIDDTTGYIQPRFSIPDGLKIVKHNPEKFQYIIRKRLM